MLRVAGKPILEWQLLQLQKANVQNVIFLENYKAKIIQDHFDSNNDWNLTISHIMDKSPNRGTSDILKTAANHIPTTEKSIIVLAGDILSTVDLKNMLRVHTKGKKLATVFGHTQQLPFGIFEVDKKDTITRVREKPHVIVPAALMVLDIEIFSMIPNEGDFFKNLEPIIEKSGQLYRQEGAKLFHISELKDDLAAANKEWPKFASLP